MFFVGLRIPFFNGKHIAAKGFGQFHLYLFLYDWHDDMSRSPLLFFLHFVLCHLFIIKLENKASGPGSILVLRQNSNGGILSVGPEGQSCYNPLNLSDPNEHA